MPYPYNDIMQDVPNITLLSDEDIQRLDDRIASLETERMELYMQRNEPKKFSGRDLEKDMRWIRRHSGIITGLEPEREIPNLFFAIEDDKSPEANYYVNDNNITIVSPDNHGLFLSAYAHEYIHFLQLSKLRDVYEDLKDSDDDEKNAMLSDLYKIMEGQALTAEREVNDLYSKMTKDTCGLRNSFRRAVSSLKMLDDYINFHSERELPKWSRLSDVLNTDSRPVQNEGRAYFELNDLGPEDLEYAISDVLGPEYSKHSPQENP